MERTILQYQKAYNSIIDKLKSKKNIIGVMVFGSMVSGDLWEESDIDLFVITKDGPSDIENIHLDEKGVPVHIKLMGKEKFINLHEKDLKGGFIHRIFASSKLVFSKDNEITQRYDDGRYYPDLDRERWNIVYLGEFLKSMGNCKKQLGNNSIYLANVSMNKCLESFAKLYVNYSGYMISKDALTMAINLDDEFKMYVDKFMYGKEDIKKSINECLDYLWDYVDLNLKSMCRLLLGYIKEEDRFLSSSEINKDPLFVDFNIEVEEILDKLWDKNIVKRDFREYKFNNEVLFKENVYYI